MVDTKLSDFSDHRGIDVLVTDNDRNFTIEMYEEDGGLFITFTDEEEKSEMDGMVIDLEKMFEKYGRRYEL